MKYIDLTRTLIHNTPVYPGDPHPQLEQIAFYDKDGFNDFAITTGMHVGTHMDGPLHMLPDGKRLCEFHPEYFFGHGRLIDARNQALIDISLLDGEQIAKDEIWLVLTGFGRKFGTPEYYQSYPEITQAFAREANEKGIKIMGMDTPSPDSPPFAIHKLLLQNDILIIENLTNLEALIAYDAFDIIALPAKFDADSAPVRVIAQIQIK